MLLSDLTNDINFIKSDFFSSKFFKFSISFSFALKLQIIDKLNLSKSFILILLVYLERKNIKIKMIKLNKNTIAVDEKKDIYKVEKILKR